MKRTLILSVLACFLLYCIQGCKEEDDTYDPYYNWEARNVEYFEGLAAEARDSMAQAKALYGDEWEDYCSWRMYKSTTLAPDDAGTLYDSIIVCIDTRGDGTVSPKWSDSVRVNYRGWLMPTQDMVNGVLTDEQTVFAQSYMGELDNDIAVPVLMGVSESVVGFATALQYMHTGDVWWVYIPPDLGYGSVDYSTIPAYSVLTFYANLVAIYEAGEDIPDWKSLAPENLY